MLAGPGVQNSGLINARLGKVALASGTEYTVDIYGDDLIHFSTGQLEKKLPPLDQNGQPLGSVISNSGEILADAGQVILTTHDAEHVLSNLINMEGVIQANTVATQKEPSLYQAIIPKGSSKSPVTFMQKEKDAMKWVEALLLQEKK